MEAPIEVFGETDDPVEDAIEAMTPLWKQVTLAPGVSHHKPASILHIHAYVPN